METKVRPGLGWGASEGLRVTGLVREGLIENKGVVGTDKELVDAISGFVAIPGVEDVKIEAEGEDVGKLSDDGVGRGGIGRAGTDGEAAGVVACI